MQFARDRLGDAFDGDYPESYDPADLRRLRAVVPQQVGQLGAGGAANDDRLLGILIGRRGAKTGRTLVETRTHPDGRPCLVARGEVLLPADAAQGVRERFRTFTVRAASPGAKPRPYVRLCQPIEAPSEVDALLADCAGSRVDARPHYVATMAAVSKGVGGPEPVPPPQPPPPPPPTAGTLGANGPSPAAAPSGDARPRPRPEVRVRVAVIDTGIPERRRQDGRLDIPRTADNIDELDVLPAGPDGLLDYQAGHGTFVAGIIERVAPGADIRMYRAADTDGFATDDDIAAAILQAHAEGAKIINLSLGVRTLDDQPPPATAAAVAQVLAESGGNTVFVAAAGNFGDRSKVWPAALDGVEAVAGLTDAMAPAPWSCHGDVQFSTVAEGVRSTFVNGVESPVFDPSPDAFSDDAWAVWSGTSFAAPQIAGAVARISYEEGVQPRVAVNRLAEYGQPIEHYGKAMRILQGIG
jgi:hypothetical protein